MKRVRNLTSLIGSTVLALLSNLPQSSSNIFIAKIIEYKFQISIIVAAILILIQIYEYIWGEGNVIKSWTKQFLRFIAKEHLGGGHFNTRISILRPQKGFRIIGPYLWYAFIVNFVDNFRYSTWKKVLKNIPFRLFTEYLSVYVRYSYPKEEKSLTHFLVSNRGEGLNGVADKCYKEGVEVEVKTCNISTITIPNSYNEISDSRVTNNRLIKKYMEDAFISEHNFSSLHNMNTKANNLYALAITDEHEKIWGVFIIDNVDDNPRSFKNELGDIIENYAKIFCFTLSTIK